MLAPSFYFPEKNLLVILLAVMLQWLVYIPTIIGLIVIGIFVFLSGSKNKVNQVFTLFVSLLVAWLVCLFVADTTDLSENALFFIRAAIVFSSIYVPVFLYFAHIFPSYRSLNRAKAALLCVVPAIMVGFAYSDLMISKVAIRPWGAEVTGSGIMYSLQGLYVLLYMAGAFVVLLKKGRRARGKERSQLYLVSSSIGFVLVANIVTQTILPVLGVGQYAVLIGVPAFLVFIAGIAYSILKHKLFDIRGIVARSVTYILVILTISMVYGLIAFTLVGGAVFNNTKLPLAQQAFYAILAVLLAFTFQPIRRFFQRVTDKIFYRDKYDPQELINAVGHILTAEIRLNVLTKEVTNVISKQMRVNKVDIVVVNDKNIYYQARVLRSDRSELELKDLQELGKPMLVADDMGTGDRKDIMDKYGLRVSITLRTSEEFVGYLLLGEKLSGDIYNEQDLAVLRIIANELAVAVQNAKAYTEIQQFNKTLQAKVVAATRKLRKANDDLKELDQAKDEFISMASHQLRTPLTTAKGYVSMVLEGDFGKINPAMKEPLTQSLDSANRMAGLVSDLLNVSRMEAGRFFIDPVEVDLGEEVPAEVAQLQTLADSKNVKLVYKKPAKPVPKMELDLDKTRQVIMNMVDNAIHYSAPPSGGGKVEVSLAQEGEDIIFKVVDNGIGVPEAQQKKLFKKFFRAANAQNTRPDGTGLGLYLVKRVVEDEGGEVIFKSNEGKGSTFGFRMPVHNKIKPNSKAAQKLASGDTLSSTPSAEKAPAA